MARISNALSQVLSAVEHLTLKGEVDSPPQASGVYNNVDRRTEWRKLLRSFSNVKTLHVGYSVLVEEISRCLRLEDGEPPLELLPELQQLTYYHGSGDSDAFTSFIDSRRNAGHPVTQSVLTREQVLRTDPRTP